MDTLQSPKHSYGPRQINPILLADGIAEDVKQQLVDISIDRDGLDAKFQQRLLKDA